MKRIEKASLVMLTVTVFLTPPLAWTVELKLVGVSFADFSNAFFIQLARSVEEKVAELGGPETEVRIASNSYDLDTQIAQINEFIGAGAQMIVLNAPTPEGVLPAIRKAQQAGIVVGAVDMVVAGADVTVTSDNFQAGSVACDYVAKRLQSNGDMVILGGAPVSSVIDRVAGCKTVLEKYPDIRILSDSANSGGSRLGGLAVMASLLLRYSKIDAVFVINDPAALGADLAARQAGRDEFFIVSVDGAPSVREALMDETSLIVATVAQDPWLMGHKGVEMGYALLKGIKPAQDTHLIPTPLITRKNVRSYQGWAVE